MPDFQSALMGVSCIGESHNLGRPMNQINIELAANRLLVRAIVAHLILANSARAERTIRSLVGAVDAMARGAIKVPDMDPELKERAIGLVRERARAFLSEFSLAAPADQPSGG